MFEYVPPTLLDTDEYFRDLIQFFSHITVADMQEKRAADPTYDPFANYQLPTVFHRRSNFFIKTHQHQGYHSHLYTEQPETDTGILLTVAGSATLDVYAESHRTKNVKKLHISSLGSHSIKQFSEETIKSIGKYKEEERRKPSKKAELIYSGSLR